MTTDENDPAQINMDANLCIEGTSSPLKDRKSPPSKQVPAALTAAKVVVEASKDKPSVSDNGKSSKEEELDNFVVPKKPKEDEELLMIGNVGGGAKAPSLQESFKRFRKQKVKERRIMQMCKEELTTKGPRTQEFKDKLRMKFVDQAKKYVPLFLQCFRRLT